VKSEHHKTHALAAGESGAEGEPAESNSIEKQLMGLRSQISDLAYEVDLYKAGIAASMGGGLFLLLLAAGAGYDLMTGKGGIWLAVGVTHDLLLFIAWGLGAAGVVLLTQGIIRQRRRDRDRDARLAELEQQYARLLDRKDTISQEQS
jgi:hypothetical protein